MVGEQGRGVVRHIFEVGSCLGGFTYLRLFYDYIFLIRLMTNWKKVANKLRHRIQCSCQKR